MSVFYFAYGSNADPDRFRSRVGAWRSRRRAWLDDHALRFAARVRSEGGGGAIVVERPGETVAGVVYGIDEAQMAAMDAEEFDPSRDASGVGRRRTVRVRTDDGELEAQIYTLAGEGGRSAPSTRYLDHILHGLEDAGHPDATLAAVRDVARRSGRAST